MEYPTIQQLDVATTTADAPFESADPRMLIGYLKNFMNVNTRLRGHKLTRQTALSSWDWEIVPDTESDKARAEEVGIRLRTIIPIIIKQRVQTALFGASLIRIEWRQAAGKWKPYPVKIYSPSEIVADSLRIGYFDARGIRQEIELPNKDFIGQTDGEESRGGLLRSIAYTEIERRDMKREWLNWLKKQKGMIQGVDQGASDEERNAAAQALKEVIKHNYMITSDAIDFKFHQIANSSAGNSFKDNLEEANASIAIAILGQANTSELPKGGGSRAALQVQQMISTDIMFSDVEAVESVINDQLIWQDSVLNYSSEPSYKFAVRLAEYQDLETISAMLEAAKRIFGDKFDDEQAAQLLQLKLKNNA